MVGHMSTWPVSSLNFGGSGHNAIDVSQRKHWGMGPPVPNGLTPLLKNPPRKCFMDEKSL